VIIESTENASSFNIKTWNNLFLSK